MRDGRGWQASAGRPVFAAPNQKTGNLMRETGSIRLDSSTGDILVTIFFFFFKCMNIGWGLTSPNLNHLKFASPHVFH